MTEEIINIENNYEYIKQLVNLKAEQYKHIQCCMTNLQQENEKLKYNARGQVDAYFKDKYAEEALKNAELIKENEFLKLNNPEMNIEHFRIIKENKIKIDNLRKENEKLKEDNIFLKKEISKLEKKYLKKDLLNILNGSDE